MSCTAVPSMPRLRDELVLITFRGNVIPYTVLKSNMSEVGFQWVGIGRWSSHWVLRMGSCGPDRGGFCLGVGRIVVVIWICCHVGGGVWMGFGSASFDHHVSASWSLAGRRHGNNRSEKLRNGMIKLICGVLGLAPCQNGKTHVKRKQNSVTKGFLA